MTVETRTCNRCGRELPATDEYFLRNRAGFERCCKRCRKRRAAKARTCERGHELAKGVRRNRCPECPRPEDPAARATERAAIEDQRRKGRPKALRDLDRWPPFTCRFCGADHDTGRAVVEHLLSCARIDHQPDPQTAPEAA